MTKILKQFAFFTLLAWIGSQPARGGTVITGNLPAGTAIVNLNATQDGAASYNGDQSLWYHPFYTGGATQLVKYTVTPGTYFFRAIDPADAARLYPALTPAQTSQIFTAWTYNSPWILDYLVFDSAAETNYSLPQLFDGSPEWPAYANAVLAYSASLTNGYNNLLRVGPLGRASTLLTNTVTFTNAETLIFVIPDYALSDNAGGVSVLISPAVFNTTNLLLNPGGELGTLACWTTNGSFNLHVDTGTFDSGINPRGGTNDFVGGSQWTSGGTTASLSQVVALVGNQGLTGAALDTGKLIAEVSFWEQGLSQATPSDDGYVSLAFWDGASNVLRTVTTPEIDSHNLTWSNYTARFVIPAGTRYLQYTMNFVRHAGSDLDAFFDDNYLGILDPASLPVLNIRPTGANTAQVYWPSPAGGWTLQVNTNPASGTWTTPAETTQDNGTNRFIVTSPAGNRFYRLQSN